MRRMRAASVLSAGLFAFASVAFAQEKPAESLKALHESYRNQFEALEAKRIDDLTALALRVQGEDRDAAFSELFNLAIASGRYDRGVKAADAYLKTTNTDPELRDLAGMVLILAHADADKYDDASKTLDAFLERDHRPQAAYAIGETLIGRLVYSARPEMAAKVAKRFIDASKSDEVKQHFLNRSKRLAMINQPAPTIDGSDPDGTAIKLADMAGKVVLVDFFATWCPPCVASVPEYQSLRKKYKDKGFEILGVSLDGSRSGSDRDETSSLLNQFVVNHRIGWPIVINGPEKLDFAKAYGVTEIPSTFLIDGKGKILAVELQGEELEKAVAQALGLEAPLTPDVKVTTPPDQPKNVVEPASSRGQTKTQPK